MDNSPLFGFSQVFAGAEQHLDSQAANTLATADQEHQQHQQQANNRFTNLYKNNDKLISKQQQRRNEILSNRLSKRDKLIASIRELVSEVASDDERHTNQRPSYQAIVSRCTSNHDALPESTSDDQTTTTVNHGDNHLKQANKQHQQPAATNDDRKFRNKAMLSEWLIDRPMDFESEWVLKATPVGRRCLVFARKGETIAYSRTGQFIKAFQSSLPGGCHVSVSHCRRQFAIVDCIYVQHNNSFYLMDALAWNEQKLYESEASFRFFWLHSRYNENQEKFLITNSHNQCRFYCLDTYSASNQDILTALNEDPLIKAHNLQLDGLLFFHIRGPYVPGHNPLVLWIKPEMASRVLNPMAAAPR